jgi:S-methylmethionine-dependent homocysteine/selenocysteine methylase
VQALANGRLVFDGPMGTQLLALGHRPPLEELNLTAPAIVAGVHRAYVEAGARVLRANTLLARAGVVSAPLELNRRGLQLAREAAPEGVWVGAAVAPPLTGHSGLPPSNTSQEPRSTRSSSFSSATVWSSDARYQPPAGYAAAVREQSAALSDADFLTLETFLRPEDLREALVATRASFTGPLLAFFSLRSGLPTRLDSRSTQKLYAALSRLLDVAVREGAAGVAINCVPPGALLELARDFLARDSPLPWGILPSTALSGGKPGRLAPDPEPRSRSLDGQGRDILLSCEAALDAGASFVGVCCGGTPEIVRSLARLAATPPGLRRGERLREHSRRGDRPLRGREERAHSRLRPRTTPAVGFSTKRPAQVGQRREGGSREAKRSDRGRRPGEHRSDEQRGGHPRREHRSVGRSSGEHRSDEQRTGHPRGEHRPLGRRPGERQPNERREGQPRPESRRQPQPWKRRRPRKPSEKRSVPGKEKPSTGSGRDAPPNPRRPRRS